MQGSVAAISSSTNQFSMGNDVFRRKLGMERNQSPVKRPGAARCLFGPPNPTTSNSMLEKVQAKAAWSFGRKWNFDITGNSQPATCLESSTTPVEKFEWNEVFDQDVMAKCDRHRYEVPIAPNTRPVTLLYAPTVESVEDMVTESVAVSTESPVDSGKAEFQFKASVSVQTEPAYAFERIQKDQETQVEETSQIFNRGPLKLISSPLLLNQRSVSTMVCESSGTQSDEAMSPVSARKERRLPTPLMIPTSPKPIHDDEQYDFCPSPTENINSATGIYSSSPPDFELPLLRRRTSIEVFTFPPVDTPTGGFKCLRIRNGSPVLSHPANKKLKQRSITEYMQVKKNKSNCGKKI